MNKTIALLIFVSSLPAFAQEGRITKAKGTKAVVEFPYGTKVRDGDTVSLGGGSSRSSGCPSCSSGSSAPSGSREHSIGGSFNLSTGSRSEGGGRTAFSVGGKYGWNKETMEYGPMASFSTVSQTASSSTFSGGAFFDYNLVPNKQGTILVYGAGGQGSFGSTSGSGTSTTNMDFFGGGFAKWFPLGNTVALRGDAGLGYTSSATSKSTVTGIDVIVKGGLDVYY